MCRCACVDISDFKYRDAKMFLLKRGSELQNLVSVTLLGLSLPQPATLLKKETLAQVFSCESCEISKNAFSH